MQPSGYAQIANSTLRDKRLSLDTRGFLCELLSHTEDWDVSVEWLLEHFEIGRDKLFRMTKELKAYGYLETPATTNGQGQFTGKEWFIYGVSAVVRETLTTGKPDDSPEENPEPEQNGKEEHSSNSSKTAEEKQNVICVFEYWKARLNHPQTKLTPDREKKIRARLREGYSPEQLKQAIDGCASSPFHMGDNDQKVRYDGVELIFRNSSHTDNFIERAGAAAAKKVSEKSHDEYLKENLSHNQERMAFFDQFGPEGTLAKTRAAREEINPL